MKQAFRIFLTAEGTRPLALLLCLFAASMAEGVSITALLPAIQAISAGGTEQSGTASAATIIVHRAIGFFGIQPSFSNLIIIVVFFFSVKALLSFVALSYAGVAVAHVSTNFRRKVIDGLFSSRWGFYTQLHPGRVANIISGDAAFAGKAFNIAAQFAAFSLQGLFYCAVALLVDWRLALVAIATGFLIASSLDWLVAVSKRAGYKRSDRTSELTRFITDIQNNIKPLKTMDRYDEMVDRMMKSLRRLRNAMVKRDIARQGLAQGSEFLTTVAVGLGAYLAITFAGVTLAELIVLGIVFFQIVDIIGKLQQFLQALAENEGAFVRTEQLIADSIAQRETHVGTKSPSLNEECRFERVSFSYGDKPVIRNVSFVIRNGSITVLQGPSGAGKTTLVDLLIGLHRPDKGTIILDGIPLDEIDISEWRRSIGYVPQELSLLSTTVRNNITLGDDQISDADIDVALGQAGAREFVKAMPHGLDSDVGSLGLKLSGGQRQRISLARALITKPRLLILDEVTSSLDPESEAAICQNISALRGQYTIIAITHRRAWSEIATQLYKVERGHVSAI